MKAFAIILLFSSFANASQGLKCYFTQNDACVEIEPLVGGQDMLSTYKITRDQIEIHGAMMNSMDGTKSTLTTEVTNLANGVVKSQQLEILDNALGDIEISDVESVNGTSYIVNCVGARGQALSQKLLSPKCK